MLPISRRLLMKKQIRVAIAAAAVVGAFAAAPAGSASAAHCVEDGSPGFSYFGQEGRTEADNVDPGASECSPAKNTRLAHPSTRAPGQNKP